MEPRHYTTHRSNATPHNPMCGRHPVGKDFCIVMKSCLVVPMCPACLLGANTDGLHAIREISSRSKARARGALGLLGFADLR
jgi:hypothetical protein